MAYRESEQQFESDYPRENYRRGSDDFRTYDGDSNRDRMSQASQAGNWYERDERRRNASSQRRSTQGFESENGRRYNRGREGDGMWRAGEYGPSEYREDFGHPGYGERYGFSAYGRAQYDPDINRGWQEEYPTWHEGSVFNDREQDYRGGRWDRENREYNGMRGRAMQPDRSSRGDSYTNGRGDSWSSDEGQYGSMRGGWNNDRSMDGSRGRTQQYGGMSRGQYSGIGPKNYKRSDERIEEEVSERLTMHGEIDPSNIEVKVVQGEVILTGEVQERRMKHLAEDIAEEVSGVKDVNNQIRVREMQSKTMAMSNENGHSKRVRQ